LGKTKGMEKKTERHISSLTAGGNPHFLWMTGRTMVSLAIIQNTERDRLMIQPSPKEREEAM